MLQPMPSSALSISAPDTCAVTVTFSSGIVNVYVPAVLPEAHAVPFAYTQSTRINASASAVIVTVSPAGVSWEEELRS